MTKRLQIPVADAEDELFKRAAFRAGKSLAEWARALLREKAAQELGATRLTPREAFERLRRVGAPVADVDTMIAESVRGRLA